jgi:phage terminase large subunit GpA-like protein
MGKWETAAARERVAARIAELTSDLVVLKPSEWAESRRYLPPSVTPIPGFFRFAVTPYLREPLDCLSIDSPIRELTFMKGVQLCVTVGLLENAIGYGIDFVKNAPMALLTADAQMAQLRVDSYITPMLQYSGLSHLIKSVDERKGSKKQGQTNKKIEWEGGGFLLPLGVKNPAKLRSFSAQYILRDEVDAWPLSVGQDGDPMKLSADRAAAYESRRKIADVSTPTYKGQSHIEKRFKRGDQRYYFVRCLKCNFPQVLRWRHTNPATGEITGITWKLDDHGNLIHESVRYLCCECGHPHTNSDKTRLLSPDHGAEWKPTAEPADAFHRSYHLSALYSPPQMQTWAACVHKWLDAWDVSRNRAKDIGKLQVFYNNVLGEPFEMLGEVVRFDAVSSHRRADYHFGQIPNKFAEKYCGSRVLLLTCTVDVQKDNLAVAVFGWCADGRAVLVDYWRFEGDSEQLDDKGTWGALRDLLWKKAYKSDDGLTYRIKVTLVDSGYLTDQVYRFCDEFPGGVFPCKGKEAPPTNNIKPYSEFKTPNGLIGFLITVDFYKDRWSAALRREWDGIGLQPVGHFNAPHNVTDAQLKELTVETKRPRAASQTGHDSGFAWHRVPGAANELWDLIIYANAALELLAANFSAGAKYEYTNWPLFYRTCAEKRLFID